MKQTLCRWIAVAVVAAMLAGCASVRFNEKKRLGDPEMLFDADLLGAMLEAHILSAREGGLGGFVAAGAGGCGCN